MAATLRRGGWDRKMGAYRTRSVYMCARVRVRIGWKLARGGDQVDLTWGAPYNQPASVFMVESHPLYLAVYPFLIPAFCFAHRAIKFGNSILLVPCTYARVRVCTCMEPGLSNLLRFISASKLMAEAHPAIPSKAHPLFSVFNPTALERTGTWCSRWRVIFNMRAYYLSLSLSL